MLSGRPIARSLIGMC